MSALSITPIPAFADNYLWLLARDGKAVVVDPGDAAAVRRELEVRGLALTAILVTHHHLDHIGGLAALVHDRPLPVYGPAAEASSIPQLTVPLREGDLVRVLDEDFEVWEVPGHTLGHIAYVCRSDGFVLCGDTLFSAGCGRLFEGTAAQLHRSLARLAALPDATRVYCTHEYTLSNLAFAAAVEPDNAAIREEIARVRGLRHEGRPSLPSTIAHERRVNPFLRTREPAIRRAAERQAARVLDDDADVFAALRQWKDRFRATAA